MSKFTRIDYHMRMHANSGCPLCIEAREYMHRLAWFASIFAGLAFAFGVLLLFVK